jgi:hypothetical protein
MDLPYTMIEGNFVSESWGLQIDRARFLVEECPLDWIDPTNG